MDADGVAATPGAKEPALELAGLVKRFGETTAVAAKRLVGVLPDGLALPERLTGRELLDYLGLLRGLDRATVAARGPGAVGGAGADRGRGDPGGRLLGRDA